VPEEDTIFRAARTLNRALAGSHVTRFESVFPALARIDHDQRVVGRVVESVASRGKHLLVAFSGNLVLRTHMRMNGAWHIYRHGERWQRPAREKSEILFVAGVDPFTPAGDLSDDQLARIVDEARALMTANVLDRSRTLSAALGRSTTRSLDPSAKLWVLPGACSDFSDTLLVSAVNTGGLVACPRNVLDV
jgi:formamidopyrimidine-DNA glycosylase